ncbi:MAG TPA: hypothetical protein VGG89_16020 [Candidatus Baltobacteraceae bacterium]|jgi:hypothetical protein
MRNPFAVLPSVLLTASLCTAIARADAKGDVLAAAQNFGAQKSVHATITTNGDTFSVDMVEPNKVRGTTSQGIQFVMIGSNTWVNMGGSWHAYPAGANSVKTQMALARGSEFQKSILSECRMSDNGMSTANGVPAHKYHVVCNASATDVWIANGLPVKMLDGGTTIVWSNFNGVTDIKPPM